MDYKVKMVCKNCGHAWEELVESGRLCLDRGTGTKIYTNDSIPEKIRDVICPKCQTNINVRKQNTLEKDIRTEIEKENKIKIN